MYRILLADDESLILRGLLKLIRWEDYGLEMPDTALNGAQAWERIQTQPYDILITDIRMPEMSGLELLEKIYAAQYRIKSIVLSGYEDFNYVKQALHLGIENYLLKPVNEQELSATLLHTIDKLEVEEYQQRLVQSSEDTLLDNVIYRWTQNEIERSELRERANFLNIRLSADLYQVSIISMPDAADNKYQKITCLRSMLADRFSRYPNLYLAVSPDYNLILLQCAGSSFDRAQWKKELITALAGLPDEFSWFLSFGSSVQGYFSVSESYASAREMLAYSFFMPANICVDADHEKRYLSAQTWKELNLDSLSQLLDSGDLLKAEKTLSVFFDRLASYQNLSPESLRSILLRVLRLIFDTKDRNYWIQNSSSFNLYNLLNQRKLPDIRRDVWRIAAAYMQFQKERESSTRAVAQRIMQYIEQNYEKELSLKTIAAALHYTPAYLGKVFKTEFSTLFSDYLCNFRIEKAKQLLREEGYKLTEIAAMTGFQSANYFSSVFKKMVGMSPSQYRNSASSVFDSTEN